MKPWLLPVLVALPLEVARAQVVPPGFVHEVVVSSGLASLTSLAFLPDGRMLVGQRNTGEIRVVAGGAIGLVGAVPDVNPGPPAEKGFQSIAVDPLWPARPYLYVHYTALSTPNVRVSLFAVSGSLSDPSSTALALGPEYRVIDDIPDQNPFHNGGKCRFGPDGFLYVSVGEDETPCAAQDVDGLLGKILRLDVSALPLAGPGPPPKAMIAAAGNPFAGENGQLVWALGLRNPYSFHVDALTGALHVADVGAGNREEIDHVDAPGLNFGWPLWEGTLASTAGGGCGGLSITAVPPVSEYGHFGASRAVISLGLYRAPAGAAAPFGPEYEGDGFFVDYFEGIVFRIDWTGSAFAPKEVFATGILRATDAAVGPDGSLYYVREPTQPNASIRRIRRLEQASVVALGSGCAGSSPAPMTLAANGLPTLGNAGFALLVTDGPGSATAALFWADAIASAPVALGAGCLVYLDVDRAVAAVMTGASPIPAALDPMGAAAIAIPVPAGSTLLGLTVTAQAVAADPLGPAGFVLSNALTLTFGL